MELMQNWKTVCFLVCVFAMAREIRPIEPFFTKFLLDSNFTMEQINENIYAMGTYSCLVLAIVMFLVTDFFRYKPLIITDGVAGILTYLLLVRSPSLFRIEVEQICYGFFYSSEVAFTTYLYAKVNDRRHYQKITSLVKASTLFGRFLSGLIAQTIVSTNILSQDYLLYISLFSMTFVTVWSLFLPKVEHSLYFHRNKEQIENDKIQNKPPENTIVENVSNDTQTVPKVSTMNEVMHMLISDFKSAYRNSYVAKKSFWWTVTVTGNIIVATYIQVLWEDVARENQISSGLMNGAVESVHTLCGAVGTYSVGYLHYDWKKFGDIIFAAGSLFLATLLFLIYYCNTLWIIYILYIIFGSSLQVLLTITASEVAKHIKPDSYGLIFGFNFFMSLFVMSIFTLLFIQGLIVVIGTKNQILTVSVAFTVMCILSLIMSFKTLKKLIY